MRKIEGMSGFSTGGRSVNNIRYADDTVLVADSSLEKLQTLLHVVNRASEEKGKKTNREKTKCKVLSQRSETLICPIQIEIELVGRVEQFQYLGSVVTTDARGTTEIKRRIGVTKATLKNGSSHK